MANYFSNLPKIEYTFADGTKHQLADINIKFKLSDNAVNSADIFYKFSYRDSDRPDSLAEQYYGTPDYYWIVLASNQIFDLNHELPMPEAIFTKYLIEKYKDDIDNTNPEAILDYCTGTIHHYEDEDGYIIDYDTFISQGNTKSVTIFDYEFNKNEAKRNIKIIEDTRAKQIKYELEDKLRAIRADQE